MQMLNKTAMRWVPTVIESSFSRSIMAMQYSPVFKPSLGKWLSADAWRFLDHMKGRGRVLNGALGQVQKRIDAKESIDRQDITSYLLAAMDP